MTALFLYAAFIALLLLGAYGHFHDRVAFELTGWSGALMALSTLGVVALS